MGVGVSRPLEHLDPLITTIPHCVDKFASLASSSRTSRASWAVKCHLVPVICLLITPTFNSSSTIFIGFFTALSFLLGNFLFWLFFFVKCHWLYHWDTRRQHNYTLCCLCRNWIEGVQPPIPNRLWESWDDWLLINMLIGYVVICGLKSSSKICSLQKYS